MRGVVASLGVGCELLARAQIVSIGPVTSAAIREMGLTVTSEASDHTEEGIFVELLRMTGR